MLKPMILLVGSLLPSIAVAADPAKGRLLAASYCAPCHAVVPHQRNEVADAPPFEVIARTHSYNPEAMALAILGPHPKMNFMPQRPDAENIAAYIATLPR